MRWRRLLVSALVALWLVAPAHAQVVNVQATDASTGANAQPGDSANNALRMNVVVALPAGSNAIGHVTFDNTSIQIGGSLPTGANTIGAVNLAQYTPNTGRLPVFADINGSVSLAAETTKVIGTVNQGTSPWVVNLITGFALAATQTDRSQKTQITDGTRDATIKAASTLPLATDTALVTTLRDALPTGANAIGKLAANSGVNIGSVDVLTVPALVAGTALIGKVGIDQTTPGTTNRVDIGTLPIVTVKPDQIAASTQTWGTDVATTKFSFDVTNYGTVLVTLKPSGTITGGIIRFELSDDAGTTVYFAPGLPYFSSAGLANNGNYSFMVPINGANRFIAEVVTAQTGTTPSVVIGVSKSAAAPGRVSATFPTDDFILTTATLLANAVYTSAWMNTSAGGWHQLNCQARSDQASAAGGFVFQFSNDPSDTNYTQALASTTITANTIAALSYATVFGWVRVVYTNGTTNQASFKLACNFGPTQVLATDTIGVPYVDSSLFTQNVQGTVASGAADSGNPVKIGCRGVSATPTAVSAAQRSDALCDLAGNVFVMSPISWTCNLQALAATLTECRAAPAAGYSLYITAIIATTTTSTAGTLALRAGTGTNCATGPVGVWPQPGGSAPSRVITLPIVTAAPYNWTFGDGLKLPSANALCAIGVATNTADLTITGHIAP